MEYKILDKKNTQKFFDEIGKKCRIWGPVQQGDQFKFAPVSKASDMDLEGFGNTTLSPKEIFFPQSEIMLSFRRSGEDADIYKEPADKPADKVVFGIRPCDAKAFALLDRIFTNDRFSDTYWVSRRDATILIGMGCNEPGSTCFCTSMGAHPFGSKGLDILASDLGDRYVLQVLTKKGKKLVEGLSCFEEISGSDIVEQEALSKKAEKAVAGGPDIGRIKDKSVLELFNEDIWTRVHEPCLNCGTCSYVCPTCHCFDIQDEVYKDGGVRMRNWDTCMSWLFTVHATGHNPRPSRKERVRQRFMHKFKYIPMKRDGETGCVGCGRCVSLCPVNIDIREVAGLMNK